MAFGRRRNRRAELHSVPPDPEDTRTQQDRQRIQAALRLRAVIDREVLPCINRLLGADPRRRDALNPVHVGQLSIIGFAGGVHISEHSGTISWVQPLLDALRGPAYRGYTVAAFVEWFEQPSRYDTVTKSIPLNENDPRASLSRARQQSQGDSSPYVAVRVKMSR